MTSSRSRRAPGRGAWLAWGLLAPALALAQEPAPQQEPELPPIEIDVVAVAREAASAAARDPTGALTTVEVQRRRAEEAKGTAELLAEGPGVAVQEAGGWGQAQSVLVRGASGNGVLVLLDGLPLNGAGGLADLARVAPAVVERLEVLRGGGAAAAYGTGALAGAVNVVTREGGGPARASLRLSGGSWGTVAAEGAASGEVAGGSGLLVLHAGRSEGDFPFEYDADPALPTNPTELRRRENNDARGGGLLATWRRPLGEGLTLHTLLDVALDSRGVAGTAQNPTSRLREDASRLGGTLALEREGGGTRLRARAFGRRDALALTGLPGAETGPQVLTVGGLEVEGRTWLGSANTLSALASVGVDALGGAGARRWLRAALFAMDELTLLGDALVLTPALRVERAGPYTLWSPRVGARLALPHGLALRASAGQSHRAPSFLELYVRQGLLLPNPDLRPERALSVDATLDWRTERAFVAAGPYAVVYEDLIAYELYPPFTARPYNFAAASAWGAELEGEARPWDGVTLAGSYTLLVSANLRDDPRYHGRALPYRPRHKLALRASAGPDWLRGHAQLLAQSEQLVNRTGTVALPARALLALGVSSTLGDTPRFTLGLEVRNVLDVNTEDLAGYPLPGRSLYATLTVALDPGGSR